jgi:formylglycine-generating enzyme required for sulfatase activity
MLDRLVADHPYDPQTESLDPPALTAADDLPCLPAEATMDERYARLTRLHRDLAGEWFEAELEAGRGSRIVFVLDEQRACSPALRAIVRANLARLWRHPVDGMPRFAVLLESGDALMAEWEGVGGGDFASWLKLRRKPGLRELIAFLAGVARVADETVERGVPGVGLMAFQVRLEADLSGEGGGLGGAAPRLFPLLLDAADLPPGMIETSDASGSTLVLVGPELACDRIHMMARLIYRAVARHEVADAVAFAPDAYIQVSGLSESGNQLLCQALCHRGQWDSCLSLIRSLAAEESLSLTGSGSGKGSGLPTGSSSGNRDVVRNAAAGPPAAVSRTAGVTPNTVSVGLFDRRTGVPPVRADSASRLSANETTGWKPVGQDRRDASPPAGSRLVDHLRQRVPLGLWLVLGASILATVAGITLMFTMGGNGARPARQPSFPSDPSDLSDPSVPSVPSAMGPEAALARGGAYENFRGMRFVEAGTKRVMFCVWETRVGDFKAFIDDTRHDAEHKNEFGNLSSTVEPTADGPAWTQAGGSWKNPHFPPGYEQDETHPVVCVSGFDAERFCVWLTKRDRNLTAGWRYRLPTDREWSAACPDKSRKDAWPPPFNGGNYCGKEAMIGAFKGYDNDLALANWSDDWPRTAPVGSFQPNSHDLYDMRGNVAEWCATSYDPSMNPGETPDPGEDADGGNLRVLRGASWCDSRGAKMRADYRDREIPLVRNDFSGFRVVLADGEPAATKSSF